MGSRTDDAGIAIDILYEILGQLQEMNAHLESQARPTAIFTYPPPRPGIWDRLFGKRGVSIDIIPLYQQPEGS